MQEIGFVSRKRSRSSKRTACERCQRRKQACDAISPTCRSCYKAGIECIKPSTLNTTPSVTNGNRSNSQFSLPLRSPVTAETSSPATLQGESSQGQTYIADVVGFLSLGGRQGYVGSSSGYALAVDLDSVLQATLWNKCRPTSLDKMHNITPEDFERDGAGPPSKDIGDRILNAYLDRSVSTYYLNKYMTNLIVSVSSIHPLYPFLDSGTLQNYHSMRFDEQSTTIEDQFWTFKLYIVYAIGAQLLKVTEACEHISPEVIRRCSIVTEGKLMLYIVAIFCNCLSTRVRGSRCTFNQKYRSNGSLGHIPP